MADDNDTPITKAILDEVVDKLVKLVGDNGKKLDTDMAGFRQELRLLSTSIKNVPACVDATLQDAASDRCVGLDTSIFSSSLSAG